MKRTDNQLPEEWQVLALNEVATTQLGKTINPREKHGPLQRPYLRNANVQWGQVDLSDVATMHFNDDESARFRLEPGDLLVCEGGEIGRGAIWAGEIEKCHFQNALHRVRPRDSSVTTEWLLENFRYLSQSGVLTERGRGITIQHLPQQGLRSLPIVIPPRREQDALVNQISSIRQHQAEASPRIQAARRAIERFRQSVLAAACSGRLTADWREQYPHINANELVHELADKREELLGSKAKPPTAIAADHLPAIPSSWVWVSVDSLASHVTDGEHKTPHYQPKGIPFITVRNLTAGAGIDFENTKFISEEEHQRYTRRLLPERGDLLISKDGTIGVTRAVRTDRPFSIFVSVAIIKPLFRQMSDYLELALSSSEVQRQMLGVGSGLQHLVVRDLKADGVPLPPTEEQREIVRRVERLLSLAESLAARIETASRRVELTSQAVLAKAFRGELSAPDGISANRREGQPQPTTNEPGV